MIAMEKNQIKEQVKRQHKPLPKFRFMAMSKLIGVIAFLFVFIITGFAMYEMHVSQNYDSMPQLIISAFAFASVYSGFYLTMAKVEHIEEERTLREKELTLLKSQDDPNIEDEEAKKADIEALTTKIGEILSEASQSLV
jgi:hypothetical protein